MTTHVRASFVVVWMLSSGCSESTTSAEGPDSPAGVGGIGGGGEQDDPGAGLPVCTDDCTQGRSQCTERGLVETCDDLDGDGCSEWGPTSPCSASRICRSGGCVERTTGDACALHTDCPGEQVCAAAVCAPMYDRDYLLSVTYLRVRRAATDIDSSWPDPYVTVVAGDEVHLPGGQATVHVGTTSTGSDRVEVQWAEQDWPFKLERSTGIRFLVSDKDLIGSEGLDSLTFAPPFPPDVLKAGQWAWEKTNPDRALQELSGTLAPAP